VSSCSAGKPWGRNHSKVLCPCRTRKCSWSIPTQKVGNYFYTSSYNRRFFLLVIREMQQQSKLRPELVAKNR
jgi:hypothetical protein